MTESSPEAQPNWDVPAVGSPPPEAPSAPPEDDPPTPPKATPAKAAKAAKADAPASVGHMVYDLTLKRYVGALHSTAPEATKAVTKVKGHRYETREV